MASGTRDRQIICCRFGSPVLVGTVTRKETGHAVLDVEHDAEDAIRYVLSRPEEYELSHISLSGFSAGGNLVIGASTLFPADTIRYIMALYVSLDMASDPNTKVQADSSGPTTFH